jgi:hypothetical protein
VTLGETGILSESYRLISRWVDVSPTPPMGLQEGRPLKEIEEIGMRRILTVAFRTLDGVAELFETASQKRPQARA